MADVNFYWAENKGMRTGFRVSLPDERGSLQTFDSDAIYNDEDQARAAANRLLGLKDKDGRPLRGSNINKNKHGEYGRRAMKAMTSHLHAASA